MNDALAELAETPGRHLPPEPGSERVEAAGCTFFVTRSGATVEGIKLAPGEVDAALDEVRGLARDRDLSTVTWWVGARSSPGVAERLVALGLVPHAETPTLAELALSRAPRGEPKVEVRRVVELDDYLQALEVDWEVWEIPRHERAGRRESARAVWAALAADGRGADYLALLGGEPVGFARAVFTPLGGLMLGGGTLPSARGLGVYTALVHARWRDAVAHGTPTLVVAAGTMSTPILEHLGFERLGLVRLLHDRL